MADVHIEDHASLIKTPQQLIVVVVLSFLVPVLGIVLLVQLITGGLNIDHSSNAMSEEAIARRLQPVGDVKLVQAQAGGAAARSGEQVYQAACAACHTAGVLNSPKTGDAATWKARLAQGEKTLVANAINGIRQMPARGGNPNLSDLEVHRAVVYMTNQAGARWSEPAAPAAAQKTTAAAPAAPAPQAPAAAPSQPAAAAVSGEKVYSAVCQVCHAAGIAGAPKTGDKAAWQARIAQGRETLYRHSIKGIRGMPPQGGALDGRDAEIKAAVDYMLAQVR